MISYGTTSSTFYTKPNKMFLNNNNQSQIQNQPQYPNYTSKYIKLILIYFYRL